MSEAFVDMILYAVALEYLMDMQMLVSRILHVSVFYFQLESDAVYSFTRWLK